MFKVLKNAGDNYHKLLYVGMISGYCGYLFNDMFIFSVASVSPTFWSLMGLSVAAGRLEHSEKNIRQDEQLKRQTEKLTGLTGWTG